MMTLEMSKSGGPWTHVVAFSPCNLGFTTASAEPAALMQSEPVGMRVVAEDGTTALLWTPELRWHAPVRDQAANDAAAH